MNTQYKTRGNAKSRRTSDNKIIYAKLIIKTILVSVLVAISIFFLQASINADSALVYSITGNIKRSKRGGYVYESFW